MTRHQYITYSYYRREYGFSPALACEAMRACVDAEHWQSLWMWELAAPADERLQFHANMRAADERLERILSEVRA